ncbi:MAG: exopolysaccharide biosynthesis polyprenyl glycosylphosphotransferase [Bacteroidota bacterium]
MTPSITSPGDTPITQQQLRTVPHRYDLLLSDFFMLNLSFLLAGLITYGYFDFTSLPSRNIYLILYVNLSWGLIGLFTKAYRWYGRVRIEHQVFEVAKLIAFLLAANTIFYYNALGAEPYNPFLVLAHLLGFGLILVGRFINRKRQFIPYPTFRYAVVGGLPEHVNELKKNYNYCFQDSAQFVGRFGDSKHSDYLNIGTYSDIKRMLASGLKLDKLVLFYSKLSQEEILEIQQICKNRFIELEVAPREATVFARGYQARQLGDMTVLTSRDEPLSHLRNKWIKRAFDILFSICVFVFVYPVVMPIVALLIWLEDPGPIFFRQKRSGYLNKTFRMWKFRSMYVNKDSDNVQARKGDKRITRVGKFLRSSSIDELPQFINVFWGSMSVVGPRPHMLSHTKEYGEKIDEYMIRHKGVPGVTGLAQVNGYRGPTEELWKMEKRVEYDVFYLENWSLVMDIKIIFKTMFNGLSKDTKGVRV